ncbi:sensor histidine kinase [Schumannella soli]|uniref:histidine kinase n=1 Tax=Schumannella soli TaxID=2590779 RepID=A0A506XZX1_9MICO|nr:HAMP domain-containing sensor histidine kinase [Schumannella soli]TPW74268.1 HAMP domain-containing histidine kinase [Schumannella soli]
MSTPRRTAASSSPRAALQRLHRNLALIFALSALVGVAAFAVVLVVVDTHARERELDSFLQGEAGRAAGLVFGTSAEPDTSALTDDMLFDRPDGARPARLVVFARGGDPREVLDSDPDLTPHADPAAGASVPSTDALIPIARLSMSDPEENGVRSTLPLGHTTVRAVAMPWFSDGDGREVAGSVVAVAPAVSWTTGPLLLPTLVGGAVLVIVLAAVGALITRRSIRPAVDATQQRERFLALAAHELRTPLARLRAGAESLERGGVDPVRAEVGGSAADGEDGVRAEVGRTTPAVRELVSIADGASRVIDNLLLAARIDQAEVPEVREPVRLDRVAADAEHLDPNVIVDVAEPLTVVGDRDLLRHLVANLVENARRHGTVPERPPLITVAVFRRAAADARSGAGAGASAGADAIVLQVRDLGPGFPAALDVTREFVTSGNGGTGLGLSLASWIARRHCATLAIGANEVDGVGGQVELVFPSAPSAN